MTGRQFWKMTGSGNDFVFFDARDQPPGDLESPRLIGAVCDRRMGVGADGVVFLEPDPGNAFSIRYFNRDGTLAELCGNASLCSVTLAAELGIVQEGETFRFGTSSGPLAGRWDRGSGPRIHMPSVRDRSEHFSAPEAPGEQRIGFARVGVPHIVVLCQDVEAVVLAERGRVLRHHPELPAGANANFVSRTADGWTYRTFERGVEGETLACGSGSVAVAALLSAWGLAGGRVTLRTRSGATLVITVEEGVPALAGEGRLVFEGTLRDYLPAWREPL